MVVVVAVTVVSLAGPADLAAAKTFKVTKPADTNDHRCNSDCSLREAIDEANQASGADVIKVSPQSYHLNSSAGDLDISSKLTIAPVKGRAIIDGGEDRRVLEVKESGNVTLKRLRITGGNAPIGGGIYSAGALTLTRTTVYDNKSSGGGGGIISTGPLTLRNSTVKGNEAGGDGGAIFSQGPLTIVDSSLSNNSAGSDGGAISASGITKITRSTLSGNGTSANGGAIADFAATTLTNVTISRNHSDISGGGIFQGGFQQETITNSTIVGNFSDSDNDGGDGGGIYIYDGSNSTIKNSIVVDNTDGSGSQDCSGSLTSADYNILGTTAACTFVLQPNDSIGPAAHGGLGNNGGPTRTHALLSGSTAIGHGPSGAACKGTDQRGAPRHGPCDTGAFQQVFCGGTLVKVIGTGGKDRLKGTSGIDGILGLGGDDIVQAGSEADSVCGGTGDDRLFGEAGNDTLLGQRGDDFLSGGPGGDLCGGGPGKDKDESC